MKHHNLKLDDKITMITPLGDKFNCHFAGGYDADGFPLVWISGNTSWSLMDHPEKYFKPTSGWLKYETQPIEKTYIYELDVYDVAGNYVHGRFFNKKDAYRLAIKLKYDWWVEFQNDRLLYGKDTLPQDEFSYYISKVEVF